MHHAPGVPLRGRASKRKTPRPDQSASARADAELRRAEDLVAEGRFAEALRSYEALAERHPDAAERETALFAAASLGARHADSAHARGLLRRYLARHPSGRYAPQVQRLLRELH